MLEQVRDAIDLGSEDILWLRDAYGIVFADVDYGRVGAVPWLTKVKPMHIEAICEVDPERREKVLMRTLHELAAELKGGRSEN